MVEPWWRPLEEEKRLSQGDIVAEITFGTLKHPRLPLIKQDVRTVGSVWKETEWAPDGDGYCHCLARARVTAAIVLTHSCQLDKAERKGRVTVSPLAPIDQLPEEQREITLAGRRIPFVPLPSVPTLGDCYADLRTMTTLDRKMVDSLLRLATMTDVATKDLQNRIAGFFVRPGEEATQVPGTPG